jgi:hypothetical protein
VGGIDVVGDPDNGNYYDAEEEQDTEIEHLTGGTFNENGLQGPHE